MFMLKEFRLNLKNGLGENDRDSHFWWISAILSARSVVTDFITCGAITVQPKICFLHTLPNILITVSASCLIWFRYLSLYSRYRRRVSPLFFFLSIHFQLQFSFFVFLAKENVFHWIAYHSKGRAHCLSCFPHLSRRWSRCQRILSSRLVYSPLRRRTTSTLSLRRAVTPSLPTGLLSSPLTSRARTFSIWSPLVVYCSSFVPYGRV